MLGGEDGRLCPSLQAELGREPGAGVQAATTLYTSLGQARIGTLSEELGLIERAGLDLLHVEDLTSSYVQTLGHWIDNVRNNRERIEAMAPGFAKVLQGYMTVAKLSFARRTALEYMLLATKGAPKVHVAAWPIPGKAK